jgi:putative ABC transport system permease protein
VRFGIRPGVRRLLRFPVRSRAAMEGDAAAELEALIAHRVEHLIARGMSVDDARAEAIRRLGAPLDQVHSQLHTNADRRERRMRISEFFESVMQDLRYAARGLVRRPGFTVVAVLTLAIGVGATTAIYSVIDATLLHPLPYPNPDELIHIEADLLGTGAHDVGLSFPEVKDLEHSGIFASVSIAGHGANVNLADGIQPQRLSFKAVTPNYFALLGVNAQLGHTFDPRDATPGYNLQAVIGDGLWKRQFGADPKIIGRIVRLDNDPYEIIGVMPPGFRDQGSTHDEQSVELWLGAGYSGLPFATPQRGVRLRRAITARLKSGVSLASAQSRIDALVASLRQQYPGDYPTQSAWTVRLIALSDSVTSGVRQSIILLFGAVGLVLLISCVNVANLLLARARTRSAEITIRLALGAHRARLMRQLLTETLLLYLCGGIVGIAILFSAQRFLLRLVPESFPHLNEIGIGWGVLAFALIVSVAAGTIVGLAPAWFMARADLIGTLRGAARGSGGTKERARTRQILVISELALSVVLMIAASLLLRSFWDLYRVPPGFNPDRVMAIQSWLPGPNDPAADTYRTATQESVLLREVLRRSKTLSGVEEAAIGDVAALPLGHNHGDVKQLVLIREGLETKTNEAPVINGSLVSPEYFHLLGMPLLRGRVVSDQDLETTPQVAVINDAAARVYWPNENPVGQRVRLSSAAEGNTRGAVNSGWTTIVGVVGDARTESLASAVAPEIYRSVYQNPFKGVAILLRGQLDPRAIPASVREQIQIVDPELPVFNAQTLDDVVADSLSARRFSMELVAVFAGVALLLTGIGLYGTISFLVTGQRREFAIRLALGAQRAEIIRMVLREGLRLAATGTVLGVAGALVVSHLMAGLLFGVSPTDVPTFATVILALTGVALAASYIPARRAMRFDPVTVLRSE